MMTSLLFLCLIFYVISNGFYVLATDFRDPFFLPSNLPSEIKKTEPPIKVVGRVIGEEKSGIICQQGINQKIGFEGDTVFGYRIEKISDKNITLVKGKIKSQVSIQ